MTAREPSRLRVACVGSGFIAGRHLAALASFEDVDIVAVADVVPDRAREVAEAYGARAYGDGLQLLDSEELDAVWLCVPPFAHGALEYAAMDRRLPFFVEKPLANDLATARDIARRVRDSGVLAAAGYHWRYLSVVEQAAAMVTAKAPVLVTGYWLDETPPVPWWLDRGRSGGQMLEQATHIFDLARVLVGDVDVVHAMEVHEARPERGDPGRAPVAATAMLQFVSGAVGTISSARVLPGRHRVGLNLIGDGYAVEVSERSLTDYELRTVTADGELVDTVDEDPIAREDRTFLDAVADARVAVRAPYDEALRSHALSWAADLSARERRPVLVAPLLGGQHV